MVYAAVDREVHTDYSTLLPGLRRSVWAVTRIFYAAVDREGVHTVHSGQTGGGCIVRVTGRLCLRLKHLAALMGRYYLGPY